MRLCLLLGGERPLIKSVKCLRVASMFRFAILLSVTAVACGPVEQPESNWTVAAYEVPLPTAEDKVQFLALLSEVGEAEGYHVDFATLSELEAMSEVSPIGFNASVWRGDDEESMASAMDFQDRIGRIWISFPRGEDPIRAEKFRNLLVPRIKAEWPAMASLPIMPSGAIPLTDDLVRTPSGYEVNPNAASKYEERDPR